MPSFEIQTDIFTRLSVFDSPKGSSNTFKTHKNISLYFKRRHLIIYNYEVNNKCEDNEKKFCQAGSYLNIASVLNTREMWCLTKMKVYAIEKLSNFYHTWSSSCRFSIIDIPDISIGQTNRENNS